MTIFYFFLAALALGILVFIHELGHYYVARKVGMIVETFSIGFGRPILKWRCNDVDWQLGWLPFGGYVKIKGMEFGKEDQEKYKEPHEIPNGFFSKAPWRRILVAVAGPLANFILALVIFASIWALGGREKTFSEFTQIIGWVEPSSEIYARGVRPGDLLTSYDGKKFTNSKDLLYAAMLGGKEIDLKGYHVDYETGEKSPFQYKVGTYPAPNALEGILTTGITTTGSYLIYDKMPGGETNQLSDGSPMEESGISLGERLVWADGELLFSMDQLTYLVNAQKSLLTVKRGDQILLSRQPRVEAGELLLPDYVQNEWLDWQYEAGLEGKWQELFVIPYIFNTDGYIEGLLSFLDEDTYYEAFPLHPYSKELEKPLQAGDRIVAIDGVPLVQGVDILEALQSRKIVMMAQKGYSAEDEVSWKFEDHLFFENLPAREVEKLSNHVGLSSASSYVNSIYLLNPVEPKRMSQFSFTEEAKEKIQEEYIHQKEEVEKIKDPTRRAQALQFLDQSFHRLLLGIPLQDQRVNFNPGPFALFGSVFTETYQTLKALVTGYLNPKWISGPIGIVQVIHHGWKEGVSEALFWIGAISVNLGFLNLLPIPVLDGGYICLALWEMVTRRPLKAKTMERLIIPFVVLLIGFLVFLTFQDLFRLF
ncbi:MAG: Metalloprotease MmpA [Chlamydiae bacterium]|nr:Metalloprotease MmpA [Chlamydiota bacterium]